MYKHLAFLQILTQSQILYLSYAYSARMSTFQRLRRSSSDVSLFMNHRKFLEALDISDDAFHSLSGVLERTSKGSEKVLVTPLAERVGPDLILQGWDKIFKSNISKMNITLQALEELNRSKFGPRSIAITWAERKPSVYDYYGIDETKPVNRFRELIPKVDVGQLRPLSIKNAAEYIKRTTNSGLPFMKKKGAIISEVVKDFESLLSRKDPCVLFTRTQENKKTRSVWGFPVADTLNEMRYYRPLLGYQKTLPWRTAVNKPVDTDKGITDLILYARQNTMDLVSIDFSSYDATIKRNLQRSAFDYIKTLFQKGHSNDLDYIFERFNTIELITPDGILSGQHGVPSGSTFTNEVDSIAQFLVASLFEEYGRPLKYFQIQGDDGAYCAYNGKALLEHFRSFGMNVNLDKSYSAKDYIVYLQMLYHIDYIDTNLNIIGGIYPSYRALTRICYQERFDDFSEDSISGRDYFAIRTLTILENCKHHPLFGELVNYVSSLDKYGLSFSDQGLTSYIRLKEKQDGKDINFQTHMYGNNVKGIKAFDSYKLLKAKEAM